MKDYLEFFEHGELKGRVFNTTGVCNKDNHYMVNINHKLKEIVRLVQNDKYFVINRPRQYGKTTTLTELEKILKSRYKVIKLDFEFMSSDFESEKRFCRSMTENISKFLDISLKKIDTLSELAKVIESITKEDNIVLIIDEVDKASNNKLFLNFLGILRSLYLSRAVGNTTTFKSVILAGVYDIRNLKLKLREEEDIRYNSPWNIAVKFDIDMSFNEFEIGTMLREYAKENNLELNIEVLSKDIYKFTNGYPFLVSRICQVIDEHILRDNKKPWTIYEIQEAVKIIVNEKNMLFDDLIKNMENNKDLYECVYNTLILNINQMFNINNPVIELGHMLGYLIADKDNTVTVSNQIIKEVIYNYMISKNNITNMSSYNFKDNFITSENGLNMEKILLKFQQFMKENYSTRDTEFLERHGVLLFLSFIKPIINGVGFDYKEVQISEERRIDIVIQYNRNKYVIEAKIWHGDTAHQKGLKQLKNYLDIEGLDKGYLLIFSFNKNKEYINGKYPIDEKEIFEVIV
jgi:hypothetical protein